MRIVFLASSKADLRWFKQYYVSRFPQGRKKADAHFLKTLELLSANPFMGQLLEDQPSAREHKIPKTPFSFVYRVSKDVIEILRVLDERADRRLPPR